MNSRSPGAARALSRQCNDTSESSGNRVGVGGRGVRAAAAFPCVDAVRYDFRLFIAYRLALYARSHGIPRALYRLPPHQVRNVWDRHFRRHRIVAP